MSGPSRVDELFSAIAPRYDLVNDLQSLGLHRLWKQRLMRLANAQPGSRVLDLCCGTGDVAGRFAEKGARVVGLDFNEQMLTIAQKRPVDERNPVHYLRGDALHLPFGNGQFDVVTVSYGLRNLADIEGGLREMYRVAKPGGGCSCSTLANQNGRFYGMPTLPIWSIGCRYLDVFSGATPPSTGISWNPSGIIPPRRALRH